jgi:hypothetical protein
MAVAPAALVGVATLAGQRFACPLSSCRSVVKKLPQQCQGMFSRQLIECPACVRMGCKKLEIFGDTARRRFVDHTLPSFGSQSDEGS